MIDVGLAEEAKLRLFGIVFRRWSGDILKISCCKHVLVDYRLSQFDNGRQARTIFGIWMKLSSASMVRNIGFGVPGWICP